MGWIYREPLATLVQSLVAKFNLTTFVETGTYLGDASSWAASIFPVVRTIEVSPEFHQQASTKHSHLPNVDFCLGDSVAELERWVPELKASAMFWLDAHAGGGYFGAEDHCPLLDELRAINESPLEHFILIDDARGFVAPPPPPFDWRRWPSLDQVVLELKARHNYYVVLVHDTIISVPKPAQSIVVEFCHRVRPKI